MIAYMSRRGSGGARSKREKKTPAEKPLARQLFSELNATFYTADPAEFLRIRIEALTLMAASMDDLRTVFAAERRIGSFAPVPTEPPGDDARMRYIATEADLILQHAAETLLRMFFAHVQKPDCPWLGMASSTDFREFKQAVDRGRTQGFDEGEIAAVFLGGASPSDAVIRVTEEEFVDAVQGLKLLLSYSAGRHLDESFLYNAAKHGLTTVQLDESTKIAFKSPDGEETVQLHAGRMLTYLHRSAAPDAPKDAPKWHISMTGALPDQDLAVSTLICQAVRNIWAVAKRRYLGESGDLVVFTHSEVQRCIFAPVSSSMNIMRTVVTELPKRNDDGSLTGIGVRLVPAEMPESWDSGGVSEMQGRVVRLPARQRDRKFEYDSRSWLLPFSPRGSSQM